MKPLVSILIPVYNRENYIADSINSALNQTYTNIEIIVVDNFSKDGTWKICQNFSQKDPRIKIFQNKNNIGPVLNWKRCAEIAQGYYSKILFSDDMLCVTAIEELVSVMSSNIAFSYTNAKIGADWANSKEVYKNNISLLNPNKFYKLLVNEQAPLSPCAILLRTKDLNQNIKESINTHQKHDYLVHGAGPDVLISLLTSKQYKYIYHLNKPLVLFREHSGSISVQNTDNRVIYAYRSVLSHFFESHGMSMKYSYLSKIYLTETRTKKKYLSLSKHLNQYSNNAAGSLVLLITFIVGRITISLIRRIYNAIIYYHCCKK